jgi:hypothetical protein
MGILADYQMSDGGLGEVLYLGDLSDRTFEPLQKDGVFYVSLSAGPYVVLARYLAKNQLASETQKFELAQYFQGKTYPPIDPTFRAYGYSVDTFLASNPDSIYADRIDVAWADWNLFKADPPTDIRLISDPGGASIWIGGFNQGVYTEVTLQKPESLWPKILFSKPGYRDCAFKREWVVPAHNGEPATFRCPLVTR